MNETTTGQPEAPITPSRDEMAREAVTYFEEQEAAGNDLFSEQDARFGVYESILSRNTDDTITGDEYTELAARTIIAGENKFLGARPTDQQQEAQDQFGIAVDLYLDTHPGHRGLSADEKASKKNSIVKAFVAEAARTNQERSKDGDAEPRRVKTAMSSGVTAIRGVFQNGKNRIKSRLSNKESEAVDLNSLSNEELNDKYDQSRKKYAKVVHQDTTRAFFKFRMPRTAKKAKEEFYALQDEFFRRSSGKNTPTDKKLEFFELDSVGKLKLNEDGAPMTITRAATKGELDYYNNLQALSDAQKNDKSPLYRSARRFANSKLSAKIATSVATGFALKIAGGALAGITAGASIGIALGVSRLRGVNNARFKEDCDWGANALKYGEQSSKVHVDNFNEILEQNKQTETAELRKRIATAAGTTALFGAAGYGIGHLISASGIGETLGDGVDWVAKKANGVVDWLRDHTPLPDSKHFVGSVSHPSFSTKPSAGETLDHWRERISGGKGLTGEKAKAASKMFEIYQDPEKTKVFTGFLKQVSTPKGAMDFARMDSLIQHSPDTSKAANLVSNFLDNAPKASPQSLEHAKSIATDIKRGLGPNGPAAIGNLQGYLQANPNNPSSETIKSILKDNNLSGSDVLSFMNRNKSLAEELLGKKWHQLFTKI